jgi:hypothetical protein
MKNSINNAIHNLHYGVAILAHFYKSNGMYVSINKLLINLNVDLAFYLGFATESVKRRYLFSNASTGNTLPARYGLSSLPLESQLVNITCGSKCLQMVSLPTSNYSSPCYKMANLCTSGCASQSLKMASLPVS